MGFEAGLIILPQACRSARSPVLAATRIPHPVQTHIKNRFRADPDNDTVVWLLDKSPAGMTIDSATGRIERRPKKDQVGDHEIELRAVDPYARSHLQQFTITTRGANLPPVIQSYAPNLAAAAEPYQYQVAASDPEEGEIRFALLDAQENPVTGLSNGMAIDPRTGHLTWTPTLSQVGDHAVTVRVTDDRNGFPSRPSSREFRIVHSSSS